MGGIRAGSSPSCGRWDDTACSDGTAGSYGTGGSSPSFSHPRRAPVPAASPDSIEMTAAASSRRTHLKLLPRSPPCAAGQLYSAPLHAYSMQLLATWCAPCHPLPRPPTPPPLLGRQWRGTIRRSTIRMVASFRSAAPTRRLPPPAACLARLPPPRKESAPRPSLDLTGRPVGRGGEVLAVCSADLHAALPAGAVGLGRRVASKMG